MKRLLVKFLIKLRLLNFIKYLNFLYLDLSKYFKVVWKNVVWRNSNRNNNTYAANSINEQYFPVDKIKVGNCTYGPLCVHYFGGASEKLEIGSYCSIASEVKFILGGNHLINSFSTFPFRYFFNNGETEGLTKGPIVVKDDVWIGENSIILSGVTLGKGTIVAAGSVVTKSTIPYSLVGGNPAQLIKMRFDNVLIEVLNGIDFQKIDEKVLQKLLPKLHLPLNDELLSEICREIGN